MAEASREQYQAVSNRGEAGNIDEQQDLIEQLRQELAKTGGSEGARGKRPRKDI